MFRTPKRINNSATYVFLMFGAARVYKGATNSLSVTIPADIVKTLNIKPGNRVEFDLKNDRPEIIEAPSHGPRFKKKSPEVPKEAPKPIRKAETVDRLTSQIKVSVTPPEPTKITPPIQKTTFTYAAEEANNWK